MRVRPDRMWRWWIAVACVVLGALGARAAAGEPGPGPGDPSWGVAPLCVEPEPPEYYAFEMVTTKNVPGTARLTGTAAVTFARSPFGVAVAADGSYAYDVHLSFENLREAPAGSAWAVWFTTPDLAEVIFAGVLEPGEPFSGRVAWNKFLAIVTQEDPAALAVDGGPERWRGVVVTRGMSRSGMMHTMAGHGPLQQENCAAWGYGG